jgi:hypothetical protein
LGSSLRRDNSDTDRNTQPNRQDRSRRGETQRERRKTTATQTSRSGRVCGSVVSYEVVGLPAIRSGPRQHPLVEHARNRTSHSHRWGQQRPPSTSVWRCSMTSSMTAALLGRAPRLFRRLLGPGRQAQASKRPQHTKGRGRFATATRPTSWRVVGALAK